MESGDEVSLSSLPRQVLDPKHQVKEDSEDERSDFIDIQGIKNSILDESSTKCPR